MQIPPTTALLNLVAALPAQSGSIATAAPAAKPTPPAASQAAAQSASVSSADERSTPPGTMRRGSMVNILA